MRHFSGAKQGKARGGRMARARSAREGFAFAGPDWQDFRALVGRYLPDAELSRRLVPILLAGFALVAITGFAFQLSRGKRAALGPAESQLALIADTTTLSLKDRTLSSSNDWQAALTASLPKGATTDGRIAMLADAEGDIEARAPLLSTPKGNLLTILGPQQPLTVFGVD